MTKPLIMLAGSDAAVVAGYAELLAAEGYRARIVTTAADGIQAAQEELPAAAVIHLQVGDRDRGWVLAAGLARRSVPVIVAAEHAAEPPQAALQFVRPAAIFRKPLAPKELLAMLRTALGVRTG